MAPQTMSNYTLRLPGNLRELAEKSAVEHGRDLAEELRIALSTHYAQPDGLVTVGMLHEKLKEHERSFHVQLIGPADKFPGPMPHKARKIASDAGSTFEPADVLNVLFVLKDQLMAGHEPTPTALGLEVGLDAKKISKILSSCDIKAKNTRRGGVSARFYLLSCLPAVEDALKGLN